MLLDSNSASASEIFARVVQLEKRGTVIGDLSSGRVMESRLHTHRIGMMVMTFYSSSIAEADLIMSDGKSLEHVGVAPDIRVTPTVAYAAGLVGLELTPEKAGGLFPVQWPDDESNHRK